MIMLLPTWTEVDSLKESLDSSKRLKTVLYLSQLALPTRSLIHQSLAQANLLKDPAFTLIKTL